MNTIRAIISEFLLSLGFAIAPDDFLEQIMEGDDEHG